MPQQGWKIDKIYRAPKAAGWQTAVAAAEKDRWRSSESPAEAVTKTPSVGQWLRRASTRETGAGMREERAVPAAGPAPSRHRSTGSRPRSDDVRRRTSASCSWSARSTRLTFPSPSE